MEADSAKNAAPGSEYTGQAPVPAGGGGAPTANELFSRQVDAQKIEFLNDRVLHLQAENETLRERHEKREQETHEFVAYFQREIQTRDKHITKLTEDLSAAKLSHAFELEAATRTKDSESQQLQQHFSSKEEKFLEQLYLLKEELSQLELFRDMKETIHTRMRELETQLHHEKETAKETIGTLERKFLEEKARLQKEHEKKIEIVKQQAKEDARNGLDADTRKIVTDNRRMGEELRFQLQMTEELTKEKESYEAQAKKYYLETQLAKSKEEEYAHQAQRQAREIKQLRATIRDLEKRMSEGLASVEREKYVELSKTGKELEELALDAEGLRRLLRLKNKELRNLRRLAQTILDQRTDVEQFFLDAMEQVKQEIVNERKRMREQEMKAYHLALKKANGMKSVRFPRLPSPASGGNSPSDPDQQKHFSEKVDLRQLTWEDRERVLRLVFAKINGIQSYADATPQDPQEQQQKPQPSPHQPSAPTSGATSSSHASLISTCSLDVEANEYRNQYLQLESNQGPASGVYFATEPTTLAPPSAPSPAAARTRAGPNIVNMPLNGLPLMPTAPHSRRGA